MGFRSVEAVRPLLQDGDREEMTSALRKAGAHRFPVERPGYIVVTREYLTADCAMKLRTRLHSFLDPITRRDWLAKEIGRASCRERVSISVVAVALKKKYGRSLVKSSFEQYTISPTLYQTMSF